MKDRRRATSPTVRKAFLGVACLAALLASPLQIPGKEAVVAAEPADAIEEPFDYLRRLLPRVCAAARDDLESVSTVLPGLRPVSSSWGTEMARAMRYDWYGERPWGSLRITAVAPHKQLRRISIEIWYDNKPQLMALGGPGCRLGTGREIRYGEDGKPKAVAVYGSGFWSVVAVEQLDAPLPPGDGHDGLRVALVDSGVAYDLPIIAPRLARRPDGSLVGYDYWDEDPRPYDVDSSRSLFLPRRHGTLVASLLLREAPDVALVPYRFPRRNLARMAALVEAAARDGVRIIGIPVGGNQRAGWRAFEAAARAHPSLLFIIAAGNNGRDIEIDPVYPASLGVPNALVVTSAKMNGRLGEGSNWGANSVDLVVPAEHLRAIDANGEERKVGGTSIAVSRIAALAARLAAANPDWRATELKTAILSHAEPLPERSGNWSRHGWIPNPLSVAANP